MSAQLMPTEAMLDVLRREHATTMKVLRAFPPAHVELRPHPRAKTARELAWVFVLECGLAQLIMQDAFAGAPPSGEPPSPPESWDELLTELERSYAEYLERVAAYTDAQLDEPVTFFTGPHTMGKFTRREVVWFLLFDQIHHRGQFSVYLRMADGKVPSIYGPSADEPWL